MNLYERILWVYDTHTKLVESVDSFRTNCPHCAFFADSKNFKNGKIAHFSLREKLRHFGWGLCWLHIDTMNESFDLQENYLFQIERELDVYSEGYLRTHPDGRRCTIHSPVWKAYLISLCNTPAKKPG